MNYANPSTFTDTEKLFDNKIRIFCGFNPYWVNIKSTNDLIVKPLMDFDPDQVTISNLVVINILINSTLYMYRGSTKSIHSMKYSFSSDIEQDEYFNLSITEEVDFEFNEIPQIFEVLGNFEHHGIWLYFK